LPGLFARLNLEEEKVEKKGEVKKQVQNLAELEKYQM
jgi:hypothetical protein